MERFVIVFSILHTSQRSTSVQVSARYFPSLKSRYQVTISFARWLSQGPQIFSEISPNLDIWGKKSQIKENSKKDLVSVCRVNLTLKCIRLSVCFDHGGAMCNLVAADHILTEKSPYFFLFFQNPPKYLSARISPHNFKNPKI